MLLLLHAAEVAELADAQDLGSCGRKAVGVQLPPSAQTFPTRKRCPACPERGRRERIRQGGRAEGLRPGNLVPSERSEPRDLCSRTPTCLVLLSSPLL